MKRALVLVVLAAACGGAASTKLPPSRPVTEPTDDALKQHDVVAIENDGRAPLRHVALAPLGPEAITLDVQGTQVGHTEYVPPQPDPLAGQPIPFEGRFEIDARPDGQRVRCGVRFAAASSYETDGLECHFVRAATGALAERLLMTEDQKTGDADDDGEGLLGNDRWPTVVRLALRTASVRWPSEPLGEGARWHVWERVRIDHVWTRRHVIATLTRWTQDGAAVHLEIAEAAPPQEVDLLADALVEIAVKLDPAARKLAEGMKVDLSPETLELMGKHRTLTRVRKAELGASGDLEVAFGRALPKSGTLTTHATTDIEALRGGERYLAQTADVKRTLTIRAR